jgi:hypothetical protein
MRTKRTTKHLLLGLAALVAAAVPCVPEVGAQQTRYAAPGREQRTTDAISKVSKLITPQVLAACQSKASQPGGASQFITLKLAGQFMLSRDVTCLLVGATLFSPDVPALAVYVAPATFTSALGVPTKAQVMCKLSLNGGKLDVATSLVAGRWPNADVSACGL